MKYIIFFALLVLMPLNVNGAITLTKEPANIVSAQIDESKFITIQATTPSTPKEFDWQPTILYPDIGCTINSWAGIGTYRQIANPWIIGKEYRLDLVAMAKSVYNNLEATIQNVEKSWVDENGYRYMCIKFGFLMQDSAFVKPFSKVLKLYEDYSDGGVDLPFVGEVGLNFNPILLGIVAVYYLKRKNLFNEDSY